MGRRKFAVGDAVVVNARGRRKIRGRLGTVIQMGPAKGEYRVEFTDGRSPAAIDAEALILDLLTPVIAQVPYGPGEVGASSY